MAASVVCRAVNHWVSRADCRQQPPCLSWLQVQQQAEAQARAEAERAALSETVRKLGRELARLEAFKRNLLHSLQAADEVGRHTVMLQEPLVPAGHVLHAG